MPREYDEICVLHVRYARGETKRVGIVRTMDGTIVAHEIDDGEDGETSVVELDRNLATEYLMALDQYRGAFDAVEDPVGESFLFEEEATPGWGDLRSGDARCTDPLAFHSLCADGALSCGGGVSRTPAEGI